MAAKVSSSPRVARRRREQASRIVAAAARRFAEWGPDQVRMEAIAEEADVARGTLYSHFPTKQSLLDAIVRPALEQELEAVMRLRRRPALEAVRGLLESYVDLWHTHRDALRVAHGPGGLSVRSEAQPLHGELMREVGRLLGRAKRAGALRGGDPVLAAAVMARMGVPLLELCDAHGSGCALFIDLMQAMLLSPEALAGRARANPVVSRGALDGLRRRG